MTSFFASTRYAMKVVAEHIDGALIFASGIPRHELERRKFVKYPHMSRRLLDPQLYLTGLDIARAAKTCTILSSYGWFDGQAHTYDSAKEKQADWRKLAPERVKQTWTGTLPTDAKGIEDRVRLCVEVQQRLGCEAFILPSPLVVTDDSQLTGLLSWLEAGLEIAGRAGPGVPRLATVALSDTVVRGVDPWSSAFLDTLLDQVSARGFEGVYIVIEQASHDHHFESNVNTLGTLVRLVRDFRRAGVERVVVPIAGVAGMLGVSFGAEAWSAGWYRGERRVRLPDFEDSDEPRHALPTYYSHRLAGDIHLKTDLDNIVAAGLLEVVADETDASAGLLTALRAGQVVSVVPEWRPTRSNVAAAKEHFVRALVRETLAMKTLPVGQRVDAGKRWLDDAVLAATRVSAAGEFNPRTALGHQRAWRNVLEHGTTR